MAGAPCRQAGEAHQSSLAQCSVMVQCAEVQRRMGTGGGCVSVQHVQMMTCAHSPHVIVRSQRSGGSRTFGAWSIESQTLLFLIFLI